MTFGKKTEWTPEEVKEMCWQYLRKATQTFQAENAKILKRLAKDGIAPADFAKFCMEREKGKTVSP